MKLVHALTLAAALVGGGIAAQAGDSCPAGGDKPAGACPESAKKPDSCGPDGGGCCPSGEVANTTFKLIDTETLAKLVAEKDAAKKAVIFDVNSDERFAKGHVPGAKHITKDGLTAANLPADKAAHIVFYCGSEKCPSSTVAAKKALALGYTNVSVYKPGIAGWEAAKQATESTPATTPS